MSLAGRLLVASSVPVEGLDRAVVLVLEHDEEGTLGIILNRPTPVAVGAVLEVTWQGLAGDLDVIFEGGPHAADEAVGVAVITDTGPVEPGWQQVHGAIYLVNLGTPPELLAPGLHSLRIFAGYVDWDPGELEDQLIEGHWYVVDSEPGDVSSRSPETLWRDVLRRQPGDLGIASTYPDDPSTN